MNKEYPWEHKLTWRLLGLSLIVNIQQQWDNQSHQTIIKDKNIRQLCTPLYSIDQIAHPKWTHQRQTINCPQLYKDSLKTRESGKISFKKLSYISRERKSKNNRNLLINLEIGTLKNWVLTHRSIVSSSIKKTGNLKEILKYNL